jgi:cytochrome d ubiquinol oxidase subunit I
MAVATVAAIAMPLTGDLLAKRAHHNQPAKLAAAEAHFETRRRAPLKVGGWPDVERRETSFAIEIPGALSLLAGSSLDTEVIGLDRIPRDQWPNVPVTHAAFQVMVGGGMTMLGAALWYWLAWWRSRGRETPLPRWLLVALVLCGPLGFLALEAGWVVTEVGRQPWVIYGVMRTADAATTVRGVWASLAMFTTVYTGLLVLLVFFVRRLRRSEAA